MWRLVALSLIEVSAFLLPGLVLSPLQSESARPDTAEITAAGIHNVYRITDKLYSGSSPDNEEGFRSLKRLRVKTIITVDGAHPDIAAARKFGMRYVHIPVGYDGVNREQALQIAKAVSSLPAPIYMHCHHGKHRGPTAAAIAHLCLDEACTVTTVLNEMRRAGTDPRYKGLYAAPQAFRRPTAKELESVSADFPEQAKVSVLAEAMSLIDQRLDHLKQIRAAGWRTPAANPDLDPPHEALLMGEQVREAARQHGTRERPEDFRRRLADAEHQAMAIESALRGGRKQSVPDSAAADHAFSLLEAACTQCHAKYRDAIRRP
jgi:protein tyrosine phosphatase (PTP) superfamily phosphohydrolase (DUF442 family)